MTIEFGAGLPRTAEAAATAIPVGMTVRHHFDMLERALSSAQRFAPQLEVWAEELAIRLRSGARLLLAGNGGSAAEAQHFAAELVGRYRDERQAYSAIALAAESSSVTAIGNDYGFTEVFARQVRAHGRAGDVLILLSTSGASKNLVAAARSAAQLGIISLALTGEGPNPLSLVCDDAICFDGAPAHVQECQLAAVHAMCEVFDAWHDRARRRRDGVA